MLKQAAVLVAVLAGCGEAVAPRDTTAIGMESSATAAPVSPLVGCWTFDDRGASMQYNLGADGACSADYESAGTSSVSPCSWSTSDGASATIQRTIAYTETLARDPSSDALVLPGSAPPVVYQRTACN